MSDELLKIFIGYDPVESVAWHTLAHSIYEHSTKPVAIVPINIVLSRHTSTARDQNNERVFIHEIFSSICVVQWIRTFPRL